LDRVLKKGLTLDAQEKIMELRVGALGLQEENFKAIRSLSVKEDIKQRYASLGGIKKVLDAYKAGTLTLTAVGQRVHVSSTSVTNNLRSVFGIDAIEKAHEARHHTVSKNKRIHDISAGDRANLTYDEAIAWLNSGEIERKGFLVALETLVELARPITGKPSRLWLVSHALSKIEGDKGSVRIRYAEPAKDSAEYKINRYRFKVVPRLTHERTAVIFCIKARGRSSYYLFPSKSLAKIQSLNLKFDKHDNSKHARFLVKVEDSK
jgi:hypothetical protein